MPDLYEYRFPSGDGRTEIYACEFIPETEPVGIIQIAHGLSEHIGRYRAFANFMCAQGFLVVGNDHLGHGKTAAGSGDFGFFAEENGWDIVVGDVRRLTERTQERHAGLPLFLLGHSMGSFIARTYIIKYHTGLSGVLMSGTGQPSVRVLDAGLSIAGAEQRRYGPRYHSRRLARFMVPFKGDESGTGKILFDWISRDPEVRAAYISDELSGHGMTVSMFRDMLGGMRFNSLEENLAEMDKDLPVYFFSGDKDLVGAFGQGVMRAYNAFVAAGMRDVTVRLYPDGRHEMLNEINRVVVYAQILDWLRRRLDG